MTTTSRMRLVHSRPVASKAAKTSSDSEIPINGHSGAITAGSMPGGSAKLHAAHAKPRPTPPTDIAMILGQGTASEGIGLTRHKISCREPAVYKSQHRRTMAATESVNVRLARGQLHRLVRPLPSHTVNLHRRQTSAEDREAWLQRHL